MLLRRLKRFLTSLEAKISETLLVVELKDTDALLNWTCAMVDFFTRQPARQQNIQAIHPNIAPLHRADQLSFLACQTMDSDAGIWQRLTLDMCQREKFNLDLDSRLSSCPLISTVWVSADPDLNTNASADPNPPDASMHQAVHERDNAAVFLADRFLQIILWHGDQTW